MYDIFSRQPDPLEDLLCSPSPPESEALRQAVYKQTRGVLRRRRLLRQFTYAAGLLLSFIAGSLVMRVSALRGERGRVSAPSARASQTQSPDKKTVGALTRPHSPDESALAREWRAFDSDDRRGELYRQAGDSYMNDECDPQSALRCYTNALDHGTKQDLTISADDNWLLMAIKDARQKENNYAKTGS